MSIFEVKLHYVQYNKKGCGRYAQAKWSNGSSDETLQQQLRVRFRPGKPAF